MKVPMKWKGIISILSVILVFMTSIPAYPQEKEEEVNTGEDFTKPPNRFDIRVNYLDLVGNFETTVITARVDKTISLGGEWKLALRADLPYVWSDVISADNPPPGEKQAGLSDFLAQAIFITPKMGKWTIGFGPRAIFPTATKDQMGTGKYLLVPGAGVKYDLGDWLKGAWTAVVIRQAIDVGGDEDRPHISDTTIQPFFHVDLPKLWFLTFSPETRYDWGTEDWHIPFNIVVGKMITRKIVTSVEYKQAIVKDLPLYEKAVEFHVGFFF
jgi:hypothetical protein